MNPNRRTAGTGLRVAFWPHLSDQQIASTRIRCYQVVEGMRSLGADVGLFEVTKPAPHVLVLAKRYDEATLKQAVALREGHGTRLVLDLCDNHIDTVEETEKLKRRRLALEAAMQAVDRIVVSTRSLSAHLLAHMPELAAKVHVIGDSIDMSAVKGAGAPLSLAERVRNAKSWVREHMRPVKHGRRLIWFGNHGSAGAEGGMQDIDLVAPSLARHHRHEPLKLTVVSNNRDKFNKLAQRWEFDSEYVPWSLDALRRLAVKQDISIIPARLNPFTECKSPNRAVTSFLMGWSVVCSPLPSYVDMFGENLVMDWDAGLESLMQQESLRRQQVERAEVIIMKSSDIRAVASEWLALVKDIEG